MSKLKKCSISLLLICMIPLSACGNAPSVTPPVQQEASSTPLSASASICSETASSASSSDNPGGTETMIDISIQINGHEYVAKLYDNETTRALAALFPLDIQMDDLNENEKYHYLSESLPTNSDSVGTIRTGDLMLYGSSCLVLFYESFLTPYSYTRLGYIEAVGDLNTLLGDRSIRVAFSMAS